MKKAVFPVALRLPALTLALLVIAALVRGCLALRALEGEAPAPPTNPTISLYDAKHDKVIELPLEEYLFGVVASEMPASFPLEALEAQPFPRAHMRREGFRPTAASPAAGTARIYVRTAPAARRGARARSIWSAGAKTRHSTRTKSTRRWKKPRASSRSTRESL